MTSVAGWSMSDTMVTLKKWIMKHSEKYMFVTANIS